MDGLQFKIKNAQNEWEWVDAYSQFGVMMGDGFIDALCPPAPLKPFVTNKSRLIDGERVVVTNIRKDSRSLTLGFGISGNSVSSFQANKTAFYNYLYMGEIHIRFKPGTTLYKPTSEVFHLIYNGESVSYAEDLTHTSCKISAKFKEPDTNNRS